MARSNRVRTFSARSRPRAATNWARSVASEEFVLAPSSKVLALTTELSNPGINETILRTHVELYVKPTSTALTFINGAFGGIVVNDLAVGVGVGSIPSPGAQATDDGWFVHQPFAAFGADTNDGSAAYTRYQIDSKAMRRVEEGFQIVWVIENTNILNTLNWVLNVSILTKLT